MQPDATYKHLLFRAFMVEELLRRLVADLRGMRELVDALERSTLTRVHEQSVSIGPTALHRRGNDMVWRVRLRERPGEDADLAGDREAPPAATSGAWLYLVVMLEFQSAVDPLMALRIRGYVDSFHVEQWRGRRFGATDRLTPVLPIVLYNGTARWSAPARVIELVTPGAGRPGRGEAGATWRAAPLFAGDGYVLLDTHRVGPDDSRRDNAAALLAGLENPSRETIAALVASLHERLRAPELRELKEVMLSWAAWQARRQVGVEWEAEEMAQVRVEDYDDVEAYYAARLEAWREEDREQGRTEGREQGRTEGREQGRAEGQRALLRRQAALKFDAETAASLAELLDGVTDQEVFDAVLAAIVGCDTPAGVLQRTAEACRHENGDNAPADG